MPRLLELWPEERSKKAAEWKNASIREKAEFLGSEDFFEELRDRGKDYGTRVLIRELQGVVIDLAGQVATLEEERHRQKRMEVDTKAAEKEVARLRAKLAQRDTEDRNMVTLEDAKAEV